MIEIDPGQYAYVFNPLDKLFIALGRSAGSSIHASAAADGDSAPPPPAPCLRAASPLPPRPTIREVSQCSKALSVFGSLYARRVPWGSITGVGSETSHRQCAAQTPLGRQPIRGIFAIVAIRDFRGHRDQENPVSNKK